MEIIVGQEIKWAELGSDDFPNEESPGYEWMSDVLVPKELNDTPFSYFVSFLEAIDQSNSLGEPIFKVSIVD